MMVVMAMIVVMGGDGGDDGDGGDNCDDGCTHPPPHSSSALECAMGGFSLQRSSENAKHVRLFECWERSQKHRLVKYRRIF